MIEKKIFEIKSPETPSEILIDKLKSLSYLKINDNLQVIRFFEEDEKKFQKDIMNTNTLVGNYNKNEKYIFESGDKCSIYDTKKNEYLDMYAGICVKNLGENPQGWKEIISTTATSLMQVGNYFYNKNEIKLANLLKYLSKNTISNAKIFFCNSGTEANEAALKFAILQNLSLKKEGKILAFKNGFHGRTLGSLSCTYNINYREPFTRYMSDNQFLFWEYNYTEGLEEFIKENNIRIVISEPIQGEGGVIPMKKEFAEILKKIHLEIKFLWIMDEIQVGLGRIGELFGSDIYDIKPDYITLAKALGNGIPIGAVICNENVKVLPGQHGTTFGGNPFATGVSYWVLNEILLNNLIKRARFLGNYLKNEFNLIKNVLEENISSDYTNENNIFCSSENNFKKIIDIRGYGLLIGIEFHQNYPVNELIKELLKERVLCISAGKNTLRICPPLIITKEEIDLFLRKLKKILGIGEEKNIPKDSSTSISSMTHNILNNNENKLFGNMIENIDNNTKETDFLHDTSILKESTEIEGKDYERLKDNLQKFRLDENNIFKEEKIIVWKISGDMDEKNFIELLKKFDLLLDKGYKIALVFGAGTLINEELKNHNIKIEYINGQRKTSLEVIDILKNIVIKQKQKLIDISERVLSKNHKLISVGSEIFSGSTDKMDTHGYVLEPEFADTSEIKNIWLENRSINEDTKIKGNGITNSIALISFLAIKDNQTFNANADICASCLAIELKSDWIGYSVGHENDIKKFNEKNISLTDIEKKISKDDPGNYSEGFKMKIKEIRKIFNNINKEDIKCYIGNINSDIPESFNFIVKSGFWIRKKETYNVGIIGSRGLIGQEIVKYVNQNPYLNLFRFSLNQDKKEDNSHEKENNKFLIKEQKNEKKSYRSDVNNLNENPRPETNISSNISNYSEYNHINGNGIIDIDSKKFDFNYLKNPNQLDSPLLNKKKASNIFSDLNKEENFVEKLSSWNEINYKKDIIDIWISACPNNILKKNIQLINADIPIIDVSSDFRHIGGWEYAMCYTNSNLIGNRISNPGCYSSAVISALYPLAKINSILKDSYPEDKNSILVKFSDFKSIIFESSITGISSHSGAGKDYLLKFPSLHETIIPYQPLCHSQQQEMEKYLGIEINFVPMVTDQFSRGIICSIQIKCKNDLNFTFDLNKIKNLYDYFYKNNEFITCVWDSKNVITTNSISETTNIILSSFNLSSNKKVLHIQSTIDNISIGGGFSTYLNLCRYLGLNYKNIGDNEFSYNTSRHKVPIDSFESYESYLNSLNFPLGFKAATTNIGFKASEINRKKVLQFTCIRIDSPAKWTAVYTRNPICGHPINIGRKRLQKKIPIQAIWINNKIANVGTVNGEQDTEEISTALANELNCQKEQIIPLSTGIIGWKLPKKEIVANISHVTKGNITVAEVARAIMTTDSYPKAYVEKLSNGVEILGIAKGAGMIEPNMGTVLVILMTDAILDQEFMEEALKECIDDTFNCISIDSDTSTSDAAILVSTGLRNEVDKNEFYLALKKTCKYLARQIVWNGEGIQHVIEVRVKNCPNKNLAKTIGKNIVNSPLTKAAICGNDPNVGRIIGSMAKQVIDIDWNLVDVKIGEYFIFKNGNIVDWNSKIEEELTEYIKRCQIYESDTKPAYPVHDNSVLIEVDMNQGEEGITIIGGDLTIDYVKINGNYRS